MLQLIEKIQFFPSYLFVYFFGTNYNIGELTSVGATLINQPACKLHTHQCSPRYTALQREKSMRTGHYALPNKEQYLIL